MSRRSSRNTGAGSEAFGSSVENVLATESSTDLTKKTYERTYDEIISGTNLSPTDALSERLSSFRNWLVSDAGCTVHSSICIVNGLATDGTKNAPVLTYGPLNVPAGSNNVANGRCGNDGDRALYEKTMGCQVRVAREIKKGEVMCEIPRKAMITPDVVLASDAGKAVLGCIDGYEGSTSDSDKWGLFLHTGFAFKKMSDRVNLCNATQLLVNILRERKKVETLLTKVYREIEDGEQRDITMCPKEKLTTRAAYMAFLIHQRFSNGENPPIVSSKVDSGDDEIFGTSSGSPESFGPYMRTLPSFVSLPICWKRNELALLSACVSGLSTLQEVATHTNLIAADLCALVDAGILHRFHKIFPKQLITWDRWVWAAAVHMSRNFPASLYLNKGEERAEDSALGLNAPSVWDDLGIMVPLLDMLNHEEESQIQWEQISTAETNGNDQQITNNIDSSQPHVLIQKRIKKGCQIYNSYSGGSVSNQELILQYGFALMGNEVGSVTIGLGFTDAVGKVTKPPSYDENDVLKAIMPSSKKEDSPTDSTKDEAAKHNDDAYLIYDSLDSSVVDSWWNNDRLTLLGKLKNFNHDLIQTLKMGKRLSCIVSNDGTYDKLLLATSVIATMPHNNVRKNIAEVGKDSEKALLPITKKHQRVLRRFLLYFFTRKLEKLLLNLNSGLKAHFNYVQLWHQVKGGGLFYKSDAAGDLGWQSFFDLHAYNGTMEIEKRYYAMGPESCVLTLYDGHLRAIQNSIEGLISEEAFTERVVKQIEELGFVMGDEEGGEDTEEDNKTKETGGSSSKNNNSSKQSKQSQSNNIDTKSSSQKSSSSDKAVNGSSKTEEKSNQNSSTSASQSSSKQTSTQSKSSSGGGRRRNRKGSRPPAIKLHIGNLSYSTLPAELFDFFARLYGRDNVLECHIPTERDTGKSRGFGFVTMPEAVAMAALASGKQHEIEGRILKVAQSNTAGSGKGSKSNGSRITNDRCLKCGFSPRYCDCGGPNNMRMNMPLPMDDFRGHPMPPMHHPDFMGPYGRPVYDHNNYGPGVPPGGPMGDGRWRRSRSWERERGGGRPSRSRSPPGRRDRMGRMDRMEDMGPYSSYGHDRRRGHEREYRRSGRGRSYSRSRSRSRSRSMSRDRDHRMKERSSSRRSRSSGHRSSRSYHRSRYGRSRSVSDSSSRSRSRSRSRSHSHSRSRGYGKGPRGRGERERNIEEAERGAGGKLSNQDPLNINNRGRSRSNSIARPSSKGGGGGGGGGGSNSSNNEKKEKGKVAEIAAAGLVVEAEAEAAGVKGKAKGVAERSHLRKGTNAAEAGAEVETVALASVVADRAVGLKVNIFFPAVKNKVVILTPQ
eukprot:CAMPEP_0178981136 /NCGR_PEP_ID=MMETSP0789-20121207/26890_1 /TAXON_ID=3005 /ORGANISM="Rhizosolenia setigera, Strain CCMP 1694" /LENGTH=1337 /DNA_ID=CAMNT_0020671639 /DNA_START=62 /DNA_END=4076 /DNA_ORIENTATION=+